MATLEVFVNMHPASGVIELSKGFLGCKLSSRSKHKTLGPGCAKISCCDARGRRGAVAVGEDATNLGQVDSSTPSWMNECLAPSGVQTTEQAFRELSLVPIEQAFPTVCELSRVPIEQDDAAQCQDANREEGRERGAGLESGREKIVPPGLKAFTDEDSRVRYYACEALCNIAQAMRGDIIVFFNDIFDALCKLSADADPIVRDVADMLDRLVKDVATGQGSPESDQFRFGSTR